MAIRQILTNKHMKFISQLPGPIKSLRFKRAVALRLSMAAVFVCLTGCAAAPATTGVSVRDTTAEPSLGYFIPQNTFSQQKPSLQVALPQTYPPLSTSETLKPFTAKVVLYVSTTTQNYLNNGNLDAGYAPQVWEVFLKKYKIPYQVVTSIGDLETTSTGVLVLPSSVALSIRERHAIASFRARGGSVLATWLCGVRDDTGNWVGFDFMEKTLDAKVVGDTSKDKHDNFLMPNGDSPISNALPAGRRVWLERAKEWYPLRLAGRNSAAHIMDWSRTFDVDKETSVIVFDERPLDQSGASRSVVIGYPERLWQSANPEHIEAINYDAIMWLLRLPSAYKVAWPAPFTSATAITIDAAEVIAAPDMSIADLIEKTGAKATYYSVAEHVPKSVKNLVELQKRGHELGFMGDSFNGFEGQSPAIQAMRLEKMKQKFKDAGLSMPANPGFHAPTESYDKNTVELLLKRGFGHYVSFMDATDSRLPFIAPTGNNAATNTASISTVVLPRTQRGPEDATEEGVVDDGLKSFFAELTLAEKMGGLSVVRLPTQSLLPIEEWTKVFKDFETRKNRMWMPTGATIAHWWRERERVNAKIEGISSSPELKVEIIGTTTLEKDVVVWVNLPTSGSTLTMINSDSSTASDPLPKVFRVDQWRAGILLVNLKPGSHRWRLQFKS